MLEDERENGDMYALLIPRHVKVVPPVARADFYPLNLRRQNDPMVQHPGATASSR